jgi:hypothetical protein
MSARSEQESALRLSPGWLLYPLIGVFIALRLAGVTDWSWWWVLSPLWLLVLLGVLGVVALLLPFALFALYTRYRIRFRFRRQFPEAFIADPIIWSRIGSDPQPDDR